MNREGGGRAVCFCFYSSLPVLQYSDLTMCGPQEKDTDDNIAVIKCSC